MSCEVAPFDDIEAVCGICQKELRGGQTRWCSKVHARLFYQNHYWTQARSAAKRRDRYQCVRPVGDDEGVTRCDGRDLEVNHIVPLRDTGATYAGASCVHHQQGLETLCHAHHVIETNRQAAERRALV